MLNRISMADVLTLPVEDRLRLIEEVWDSITAVPEMLVLTDAQRRELDSRLDAYHHDRDDVIPWEEIKARILDKP